MNAFHFLAYPGFENDVPAVDFTCVEQRGGIACFPAISTKGITGG